MRFLNCVGIFCRKKKCLLKIFLNLILSRLEWTTFSQVLLRDFGKKMHIDIYTRALTSKYRSNDASLADTLPLCNTLLSVIVIVWVQFARVCMCVLLDACFDVLSMEFCLWLCEHWTYTNVKTTGPYQCMNPSVGDKIQWIYCGNLFHRHLFENKIQ